MKTCYRPLILETLESRQLLAANALGFQNPLIQQDVNNDDMITPIDAVLIANRLNGVNGDSHVQHFLDVDGSEDVTVTDGQEVIDGLNGKPRHRIPVFEHVRHIARKLRQTHPNLPQDLQTIGNQVLSRIDEFEGDIQAIRGEIREFLDMPDLDRTELKTRIQNIRNTITQHASAMIDKLNLLKTDEEDTAQLEADESDNRAIPIPRRLREAIEIEELPEDVDAERVVEVMEAIDKRQWKPFRHRAFQYYRAMVTPETRARHLERLQEKINSGTLPEFINTERASRFLAALQSAEGEATLAPNSELFSRHDQYFAQLELQSNEDSLTSFEAETLNAATIE